MSDFNQQVIEEFRANNGKVGGPFQGSNMLLLTTTGARSGKAYTSPLVYSTDGDRILIVASAGGAPHNPAWYHNLRANPLVTLEVGNEQFQARATVPAGEERTLLFNQIVAKMPGFGEYQQKTTRQIPVVVLERVA